jgi:hypothetical protein
LPSFQDALPPFATIDKLEIPLFATQAKMSVDANQSLLKMNFKWTTLLTILFNKSTNTRMRWLRVSSEESSTISMDTRKLKIILWYADLIHSF